MRFVQFDNSRSGLNFADIPRSIVHANTLHRLVGARPGTPQRLANNSVELFVRADHAYAPALVTTCELVGNPRGQNSHLLLGLPNRRIRRQPAHD